MENSTLQAESEKLLETPAEKLLEPPAEKLQLKVDCLRIQSPEWVGFEYCAVGTHRVALDSASPLCSRSTVLGVMRILAFWLALAGMTLLMLSMIASNGCGNGHLCMVSASFYIE